LVADGPSVASRELRTLMELFGRDRVLVELWDHGHPLDSVRNDALAELAARHDVGVVATNNVHYATPAQRRLASAVAAVRARRSLDELDPWLPAASSAHLRSGADAQHGSARIQSAARRTQPHELRSHVGLDAVQLPVQFKPATGHQFALRIDSRRLAHGRAIGRPHVWRCAGVACGQGIGDLLHLDTA
jgi:DNA polymerase III alpha subunit